MAGGTQSVYLAQYFYQPAQFLGSPPAYGLSDQTAAAIAGAGTQSAGGNLSAQLSAYSDHVHPVTDGWAPSMNNLKGANGALDAALGSNTAITAGAVTLLKIPIWAPGTISSLQFGLGATGVGTSSGSYVGIYSSGGTLLTGSADMVTPFTAAAPGTISCALGTAVAVSPGFVWAAVLSNLGTTQPSFFRYGAVGGAVVGNMGLTPATYRFAANGTGQHVLPGTINPASNVTTNAFAYFVGWS